MKNTEDNVAIFGFVAYALFWVIVWVAYLVNIFKLINHVSDPVNLLIILRVVGIFITPLGSVLGFF